MSIKEKLTQILLVGIILAVASCSSPTPTYIFQVPERTDDGWETSTPEEQGMDSAKLVEMMEFIDEQDLDIDSVVVVRNGHIVLEEYPNQAYGRDDVHPLYSAKKSVFSALIGIAIQEGFIESVDQKVEDFFPERTIANLDSRKQNMTLEHLLTMTSGLEWDERTYPYGDSRNDWTAARTRDDPALFALDRPMANDPGMEWVYNTGGSHLLSVIITRTTGQSTIEFAREFLFGPLGISEVVWGDDYQGINNGANLLLTPRDMAKFGYLYLNNGTWEGTQILPAEWVARSTETHFVFSESTGYGYQWWTLPQKGVYYAAGLYKQRIYVIPDLDMVVVFTANISNEDPDPEPWLLHNFIGAAVDWELLAGGRYTKYGLSFDYPGGMHVTAEMPIPGKEMVSDDSGWVQFDRDYPFEQIGVIWDTAETAPELEAVLDEFLDLLVGLGVEVTDRGPFVSSMSDDNAIVYQYVSATTGGLQGTMVMGSWYVDEAARVCTFYYATRPWLATQQEVLTEFQRHLDSFVCH